MNNQNLQAERIFFHPNLIKHHLWLDVRSPGEHNKGSIPGAMLLPIFNNKERALIGTLYKNYGKNQAVEKGYAIVRPKIPALAQQVQQIQALAKKENKKLIVFCARGGMRSSSVCHFMQERGIPALQMFGGYKAYRAWVVNFLAHFCLPNAWVLYGKTGTGKTWLIQRMPNALNLESLCQHRGSLFGGLGLQPTTQQWFENTLMNALLKIDPTKPTLIEGESTKIGPIFLPRRLWQIMQAAPKISIFADLETRVQRICAEYPKPEPESILAIIAKLKHRIGSQQAQEMSDLVQTAQYGELVKRLLTEYYDAKYEHSHRKYHFYKTINANNITTALQQIKQMLAVDNPLPTNTLIAPQQ